MIVIVVDGFAYRVLNSGLVECAPIIPASTSGPDGPVEIPAIDTTNWGYVDPEKRNMDAGQEYIVRGFLQQLTSLIPEDRLPMPSQGAVGGMTADPGAPMGRQTR